MTAASGIALFLIAAIIPTHQFTPLVVIMLLAAFVVVRLASPGLLLFAIVSFALWTFYVASPFVATYLASEVQNAGAVTHFTGKLVDTASVSPGQAIVSWASRGLTAAVGLAALIGFLRRFAAGYRDLVAVILVLAPIPIGLGTSYGGEVIFRVYLFALPGLAFFAAASIFPTPDKGRAPGARALAAVLGLALAVGFVLANNGKDRQYVPTQDEIAAVDWLYTTAPPGSLLIEGAGLYPRQMKNYENFAYVAIAEEPGELMNQIIADPANELAGWMNDESYAGAYVIITRSQKAYVDAVRPMPKGALDDIEQKLLASPRFTLLHEIATVDLRDQQGRARHGRVGAAMSVRFAVVIILILAAVLGLQFAPADPVRIAAMLPFIAIGPGIAWVGISDRLGAGGYAAVAVSVSFAFSILIATLLLFTQFWSPELGLWLLIFAAAFGLFFTDN